MTLEERVAALERAVEAGGVGSLAPNYLTQDSQGRVGAEFAGHVRAAGIDLPAGNGVIPPGELRVRWLNAGGALVADLLAYELGPLSILRLGSYATDPSGASVIRVRADGGGGTEERDLLDSNGNSAWVFGL
jgi:hypothetical protein